MKKVTLDNKLAHCFLNVSPVSLVSSYYEDRSNICTISWCMPVSFVPPIVAIAIGHGRFSHYMIENSRQFIINLPDKSILEAVQICGSVSGRRKDKFVEADLTKLRGLVTNIPLISECFAHLECQVQRSFDMGDHTIFCGNVEAILADSQVLTEDGLIDLQQKKPLIHLGRDKVIELAE